MKILRWFIAIPLSLVLLLAACGATSSGTTPVTPPDTNPGTDTGSSGPAISTGTAAEVVTAADAFLATLDDTQRASVVVSADATNAVVWSNLPASLVPRNGIELSTLSDEQLAAAKAVVQAALGTAADEGYDEAMQILAADDVLGSAGTAGAANGNVTRQPPSGPGGGGLEYSSGLYYLALLGTPNTTGAWQLQFGGHHLAVNINYNEGSITGATPEFRGIEPRCWTVAGTTTTTDDCTAPGTDGTTTTYAPMYGEQTAVAAMLASLDAEQLASAQLSETFSDILLGPGQDGQFPETKVGLAVSELSAEQQALVLAAIAPWVQDVDDTTAAALLDIYESELDETFISFSGDASLSNNADYVRIDGPSVWIELVCQNGVVYSSEIHYHSVWRDHTRDYGAEYSF